MSAQAMEGDSTEHALNPFHIRSTELRSELSAADCLSRLRATCDANFSHLGFGVVVGEVRKDHAILRWKAFPTTAYGDVTRVTFLSAGGGSQIRCQSGMSRWMRFSLILWLVAGTGFGFFTLLTALSKPSDVESWLGFLFVLAIFALGFGGVSFFRLFDRRQHKAIVEFLTDELKATLVEN